MRLKTPVFSAMLSLLIPALLQAATFNEANVLMLDGTVMVQKADGSKPFALQTGSVVEKGDILTCYDKSWVILKTHKGDRIGLDGNTMVTVDEYYIEGPDRQIRFVLQKGNLYFKTNGCGSHQSFFEVNAGSVVASINDVHAILHYDPAKENFQAQYLVGKLTVIDRDHEEKFKINHTENSWVGGKMAKEDPDVVDELDVVNFGKFFDGEPRVPPPSNNFLLKGSD
jgi:hypothetical protein